MQVHQTPLHRNTLVKITFMLKCLKSKTQYVPQVGFEATLAKRLNQVGHLIYFWRVIFESCVFCSYSSTRHDGRLFTCTLNTKRLYSDAMVTDFLSEWMETYSSLDTALQRTR